MRRIIGLLAILYAITCTSVSAIDGYGVYTLWHEPFVAESPWNPPSYMGTGPNYGPIIGVTIKNNKVVSRDTLFPDIGECPSLSFDGKRVGFFRWSVRLTHDNAGYHLVSGTENGPHYISVVDIQTKTVTNIIQVNKPCGAIKDADAFMDWPAGDWIYYEKPTETRQFYRVNVKNPTRNELICTDNGDAIRRWNLSSDAKFMGAQSNNLGGVCKFPLVNNSIAQSDPVNVAACNMCVSTMGCFLGHYFAGNHEWMCIERYDHTGPLTACSVGSPTAPQPFDNWETHQLTDLQNWGATQIIGPNGGGAEVLKWSVNSEKWALRMIGECGQAFDPNVENCVAVNWVDSQAINLSQLPPPQYCGADASKNPPAQSCADVGDLWVDFGAGNEHKWEDETGNLHILPPIDPVDYTPTFTSVNVTCVSGIAVPGQKLQFVAEAWDQELVKISPQPAFTWSVSGGGTISTTGLFTAGSSAGGPYTVTATATAGGTQKSGAAAITIKNKLAGVFYYVIPRNGDCIPDLSLYPFAHRGAASGSVTSITLTGVPTKDKIAVRFSGLLDVPSDGQYTFYTTADDGCILWIDGTKVTSCHYSTGESSGNITLTAGLHPIAVDWSQGCCGMELAVSGACASAGITKQVIPANRLFYPQGGGNSYAAMPAAPPVSSNALFSLVRAASGYTLIVRSMARHTVTIAAPTGRLVGAFSGEGRQSYRISSGSMAPGVYVIRGAAENSARTERMIVY